MDVASLPVEILETSRVLDRQVVRFRWKAEGAPMALADMVAALPVGGELDAYDRKYRDAVRCLRRTASGLEIRSVRHGCFGDWEAVPTARALAWIADVAYTTRARQDGCRVSFPAA